MIFPLIFNFPINNSSSLNFVWVRILWRPHKSNNIFLVSVGVSCNTDHLPSSLYFIRHRKVTIYYYYTFTLSHVTKQDYTCHKKVTNFLYALSLSPSIVFHSHTIQTKPVNLLSLQKLQNHSNTHVEQHKAYFMTGMVAKYKIKTWKLKCLKECMNIYGMNVLWAVPKI